MPLYQQIFQVLPKFPLEGLVTMFKKHSKTILNLGGNVRGIENHGLRPLPERTRRLFFSSSYVFYLVIIFCAVS
jgi:hypothetical protein